MASSEWTARLVGAREAAGFEERAELLHKHVCAVKLSLPRQLEGWMKMGCPCSASAVVGNNKMTGLRLLLTGTRRTLLPTLLHPFDKRIQTCTALARRRHI